MSKKMLVGIVLVLSLILSFTPCFAASEMKKASDYFTVDDYSVEYNGCVITATFNAVTDNILSATYDKNMIINTDVTGVCSLEHIGVQHLKFNCTDRVDYQFGWAQEAE